MTQTELESSQNSRTRLIEAAIFCFSEKGFDGSGIREIALRAQANSALVQYHFGGKEGLYAAALTHIFEQRPPAVMQPPTDPEAPGARAEARQAVRAILHHLLEELLECDHSDALDQAAHLLVTREMLNSRSETIDILLRHIQPYVDHMDACIRVLRPDLDDETRMDMSMSVYGPIFHLHTALPLIRSIRKDPAFPRDLEQLADHFTDFSLRGIGSPEASPKQGV